MNPCIFPDKLDGIRDNMVDIEYVIPLMNSTQTSSNQFSSKIRFIDDNTQTHKQFMHKFNRQVLGGLERVSGHQIKLGRLTNEMMFVSISKLLFGNPHEPHSYLLE